MERGPGGEDPDAKRPSEREDANNLEGAKRYALPHHQVRVLQQVLY